MLMSESRLESVGQFDKIVAVAEALQRMYREKNGQYFLHLHLESGFCRIYLKK